MLFGSSKYHPEEIMNKVKEKGTTNVESTERLGGGDSSNCKGVTSLSTIILLLIEGSREDGEKNSLLTNRL